MPIKEDLPKTADKIPNNNNLNSYLPIRSKDNDFSWNVIAAKLLSEALRKQVENYSFEQFEDDCKTAFADKTEEAFWPVLHGMYFANKDIFAISPELLLFRAQKGEKSEARVAALFIALLQKNQIEAFDSHINFLERTFLDVLKDKLKPLKDKLKPLKKQTIEESPYLPFLAASFQEDIRFLASKPKYFLAEIENVLAFYGFTYCAQLAVNITDWKAGKAPEPKLMYFIMDHEKASAERTFVSSFGYKQFNRQSARLFPILSMLENLQKNDSVKQPLWKISADVKAYADPEALSEKLRNFARAFKSQRELNTELDESKDPCCWLNNIMKLAQDQFTDVRTTRASINNKYVKEIEIHLAKGFIQARGRAGKVLVLNQDYLILLTNLAIGRKDKLRLHELLQAFQQRGVYVDKQTEQELISFYERIGNVERMSDSGDAVYVLKTI